MNELPPSSGSVPPPRAPANAVAGRYAASLGESNNPPEVAAPVPHASGRSLSSTLVPLVALYFLVTGVVGVFRLIETLPRVLSTPHTAQSGDPGSTGWSVASHGFGTWWFVSAVITLASIYAGVRLLHSDERGREVGILLALSGLAFALVSLSSAASSLGVGLIAINAVILWVLLASKGERR